MQWVHTWTVDQIKHWQSQDECIGRITSLKSSYSNQPPRHVVAGDTKDVKRLWSLWDQLVVVDGLLRYKWLNCVDETWQILLVAPFELRTIIFQKLHCDKTAGHFGRRRTIEAIRRRFYWPGMSSDIRRWVRQCDLCARRKPGPGKGKARSRMSTFSRQLQTSHSLSTALAVKFHVGLIRFLLLKQRSCKSKVWDFDMYLYLVGRSLLSPLLSNQLWHCTSYGTHVKNA